MNRTNKIGAWVFILSLLLVVGLNDWHALVGLLVGSIAGAYTVFKNY